MSQPIFLTLDQVIVTESNVPVAFTDDDILQYVLMEQPQLFPTLDQEIYFDFLVKHVDEENKVIVIVACNRKDFSEMASTMPFLKIAHEDFKILNLLPWRQREKQLIQKRQLKIFAIVAASASVIMLMMSLFYMHIAHQDKKRALNFSRKKHDILSKVSVLEKSNQEQRVLIDHWKNKIDKARHQSNLAEMLVILEGQRPEDMVLEQILLRENTLFIRGKSKEASAIKVYIARLIKNKIGAQLKLMKNSADLEFPIQFEIEAEGVLK